MNLMATWRELLIETMNTRDETLADLVSVTLSEGELDATFNEGYGSAEGAPFTAWSHKYVYFPVCYDGAEWVGSVARHPDGHPTPHHGGW